MPKYEKTFKFDSREVEFEVDNSWADIFSELVMKGCLQIIETHWLFKNFPRLKIKLHEQFGGPAQLLNILLEENEIQSAARVDTSNVKKLRRFPELMINVDVPAASIMGKLRKGGGDVTQFLKGNISSYYRDVYIKEIQGNLLHEGIHLLHALHSDFFRVEKIMHRKIERTLKKYDFVKHEINEFTKLLKSKGVKLYGVLGEETLKAWKELREALKMFIDMIFYEGLAVYVEKEKEYPFEIGKLKEKYEQSARYIEGFNQRVEALMSIIKSWSKIEAKGEQLDLSLISEASEEIIPQMLEKMRVIPYYIGPHMVQIVLYKNGNPFFIEKLIKMNSFEFIKEYEKSCKVFNLRPLVSLYSGKGLFDYKKVLIQWAFCSECIKRVE